MARRHWDGCDEVERNTEQMSAARVFKGTRLPLSTLYQHLAGGVSIRDVVHWFPGVAEAQLKAVLEHDAETVKAADGW